MNPSLTELWQYITQHFQRTFVELSYNHWIKSATPIGLDNNFIYIELPTEAHKFYWEQNLYSTIIQLGFEFLQRPIEPKFTIKVEENRKTEIIIEETVASPISHHEPSTLNPKYTFDTFIPGEGSRMAHAAALVVCDRPGILYNPLFFYGGVGLGKTHLMQAIGNQVKSQNPAARVKYVTSETFTNDLISSLRSKSQSKFREKYRDVDVLLVDDIQFFADKEATQEEFFHTFNELYMNQKQIVLTSDRHPNEIKDLQERLVSRFVSGLPVDITPPDLETRIAILSKKAETLGIDISTETLAYIAGQIHSNVRELEGALVRVQAFSVTKGEDISTSLAANALENYSNTGKEKIISIYHIQQEVARYYQLTVEDLTGKKRTKNIVQPRQIAMYLSRTLTNSSLPKIGSEFGGKDHTTVMHAYEKIHEAIQEDFKLSREIEEIKHKLK